MINIFTYRYWLIVLLVITRFTTANAQVTLTIYYGDPAASPDAAFDGNVFQAGSQFGDAPFYVKFGGSGTRYFEIDSPGENTTKKVNSDGFVFIRPISSMVIDQSKIKNFSGTVTGSVAITVKPLSITTISSSQTDVLPGTEISVSYRTGAGTFPVDLASNSFKVQLLSADGLTLLGDLLNSTDQYSGREQKGSSFGGIRSIKATVPGNTSAGTYRVRVVTRGLIENVMGSASSPFLVGTSIPVGPAIGTSSSSGSFCAGSVVSFPFSTTGTFPSGNAFKVQLVNTDGSLFQELSGTSLTSPINAILPASLATGTYRFRIAATATSVQSNTGSISISALPTLTISGSATTTAGSTAPVQLTFTGTPPWSFTYIDNNTIRTANSLVNQITITPTFSTATTFDKSFIKGFKDSGCGLSDNISGSAQILISKSQISLTTGIVSGTYCPGITLPVSFTAASNSLPTTLIYQVQLSDATGNFVNGPIIGSGSSSPITATLPTSLSAGLGYRVQVIIQKPTTPGTIDYSTLASSVSTSIAINRPDPPKVADVSFCSTAVISPLNAIGTNLKWYNISAQLLPGAPTPPSNQPSTYYVSQTANGCESLRATINVTPTVAPTAPTVSSVSLCQGGQSQYPTAIPNALWYTSATGGVGSPQTPIIDGQTAGEQTVYVSQTINGCESPRTAIKAVVYSLPTAPTAPTSVSICQYAATTLAATGSELTWYNQSGIKLGATFTPPTSTTDIQSYLVSQTVNGCESPRTAITVVIRPAPTPPVAASGRYCVGEVAQPLSVTGLNVKWYTEQTGGSSSGNSPAFFTVEPRIYTFYVTQTDVNSCESLRQPVSVSVVAPPSAPSVKASQLFCQFTQADTLRASPNVGLIWEGPGITSNNIYAPVPVTSQPGTFTYLVAQKAGSCISPKAQITVRIAPTPSAPDVSSTTLYCVGAISAPLTATGSSLTWYTNANHSGQSFAQVTPSTQQAGATVYYVTQKDANNCESPNSSVEVRVSNKASATLSGDGSIYPGDSTAVRIRLTGDGPWTFTDWNNRSITATDSLYVIWVRPTQTRSYAITNLQSTCGPGNSGASYTLTVLAPLGTQSLAEPLLLKVYPNPTNSDVSVDWNAPGHQLMELHLINSEGKIIQRITRQATGQSQTETLLLGEQPVGKYYLRLATPKNGMINQSIIKQ